MATRTLKPSAYLVFADERDDGFTPVYHSLFGNLTLLDRDSSRWLQGRDKDRKLTTEAQAELEDRFFLVPEGEDERSLIESAHNDRLLNASSGYLLKGIQLVLTNSCNLGCSYCYQDTLDPPGTIQPSAASQGQSVIMLPSPSMRQNPTLRKSSPPGTMSAETACQLVRSSAETVCRAGNTQLSVEFFGGEPLLAWGTIESVLTEVGRQHAGVQIFYSMTTNATRVTPDIARVLADAGVAVAVSYDADGNLLRTTKAKTSAVDQVDRGLQTLAAAGVPLNLNTVVSTKNAPETDPNAIIQVAASVGAHQIGIILDLDAAPYSDKEAMAVVMDKVLDICREASRAGISITGYWHQIYEQIAGQMPLNLEKGYKTCAAEGAKLSFEPDGSVRSCKIAEDPVSDTGSLARFLDSDLYLRHVGKAFKTDPACNGCAVEGFCSGLCVGTIVKNTGDLDGVVEGACDVYRELTRRLVADWAGQDAERIGLDMVDNISLDGGA